MTDRASGCGPSTLTMSGPMTLSRVGPTMAGDTACSTSSTSSPGNALQSASIASSTRPTSSTPCRTCSSCVVCVVVRVADAADRGLDAGLGQALGVFDRDVLHAPVRVMDEPATAHRPSFMQRLFERIEDEAGMRRPAHPPADDAPGKGVDEASASCGRSAGGQQITVLAKEELNRRRQCQWRDKS